MEAIVKKTGFSKWEAEYKGQTFSIWHSYLWDENHKWHYYYTIDRMGDGDSGYYRELAGSNPMTPKLATKLCKRCLANIK